MTSAPMLADFAVRLALGLSLAAVLDPVAGDSASILPHSGTDHPRIARTRRARSGPCWRNFDSVLDDRFGCGACLRVIDCVGPGSADLWSADIRAAAIAALVWLTAASRSPDGFLLALNAASRAASGLLLGAVLCSMLLGHYYLTAPAMTIDPLKRTIVLITWALSARALLAGHRLDRGANLARRPSFIDLRSGHDGPFVRALGHGIPGRGNRHLHDVEDGSDTLDAVGDGDFVHHDDLCFLRRAVVAGAFGPVGSYLLRITSNRRDLSPAGQTITIVRPIRRGCAGERREASPAPVHEARAT